MKIKIVSPSILNSLDKTMLREYDYILNQVESQINTSNNGLKYRHDEYRFIDENKGEVLVKFNEYIEAESGFKEYWNGNQSGSTIDTKIKLKEKLTGNIEDYIFKEESGSSVVKKFLNVVYECQTINEIRLKIEINEMKSKIEYLEKYKIKLNKIYKETLEYVKQFQPNMFLIEKIKDISGDTLFSVRLNRLEKKLKKHNDLTIRKDTI